MKKWTPESIRRSKGKHKIACLTAYDYSTARFMDEAGLHMVLVGDSLAMTILGYEDTLPVTMEQMLHHTAAVARGVKDALVIGDMPFMSYQASVGQAIENAGRFIKEASAGAVKVEGGVVRAPTVRALVDNGIPVLGHIGMTPQSVRETGGFKVRGKSDQQAEQLVADAVALEKAGAFGVVVECVPAALGETITREIGIPTIGIGAGPGCDGQVLVSNDMLGLFTDFTPRFVRKFADLGSAMREAFEKYRKEVEEGNFPGEEESY